MTAAPVRTVFLGSGAFGRESLRRLASASTVIELVGVVTAPPRPAGRGGHPATTVIHDTASDIGAPSILTPERLRDPASIAAVLALRPGLVVLADYGRIVPAPLLDLDFGALNLHPSLLPRHRGATPIQAAILAGDDQTGVTMMRMDAGIDTGPIVAQVTQPLDGQETTPRLEAVLERVAADLLDAHIGAWLRGELTATPQDEALATMTRSLRRDDGRLDVMRPAGDLDRQIRALQPWPGSFIETGVGRLIVWSATPERDDDAPIAGTFDGTGLGVGSSERLRLGEVQLAGGNRMAWDAFVRGRPAILGSIATS